MDPLLNRNLYLIKEHVGMFKAANNFDIFDPETGEVIMHCREPKLGGFTKLLRFTDYKRMTPFNVVITTPDGRQLVRISRGVSFFLSKVTVFNEQDQPIGMFKQKFWSVGGKFNVLDMQEQILCTLKGKWTGWNFRFIAGETEYAQVAKKWAGLGKEFFTSADNYVLEVSPNTPPNHSVRAMIIAAVMCIDMVLKE